MKRNEIDDYIVTYTEKYFSTSNPRAEDICLEDIAHSLSMMCRFNSHSPVLYSVAQHSIHCAEIAKDIGLSEESQL
ncbi:hypothetical protein, partial [Mycobacterium tuberculosis]|uniref:hypothetical protein n=1 Tax=Mycobacterium tuberculosis TaxID=1773 RepID=UPI003F815C2C